MTATAERYTGSPAGSDPGDKKPKQQAGRVRRMVTRAAAIALLAGGGAKLYSELGPGNGPGQETSEPIDPNFKFDQSLLYMGAWDFCVSIGSNTPVGRMMDEIVMTDTERGVTCAATGERSVLVTTTLAFATGNRNPQEIHVSWGPLGGRLTEDEGWIQVGENRFYNAETQERLARLPEAGVDVTVSHGESTPPVGGGALKPLGDLLEAIARATPPM